MKKVHKKESQLILEHLLLQKLPSVYQLGSNSCLEFKFKKAGKYYFGIKACYSELIWVVKDFVLYVTSVSKKSHICYCIHEQMCDNFFETDVTPSFVNASYFWFYQNVMLTKNCFKQVEWNQLIEFLFHRKCFSEG